MAFETHNNQGRPLWKPDQITIGKFRLDPAQSPMENLWRLIRAQASIWLAKYDVYTFDGPEPVDDLYYSLCLAIYLELRRRVWLGEYNRNFSLYLNVRSCAWAKTGTMLKQWKKDQDKIHSTLNLDQLLLGDADSAPKTLGDTISYEEGHLSYRSKSEINVESKRRHRQRHNAKSLANPAINAKRREAMLKMMQRVRDTKEQQDEYDKYVSECEFFGIEDRLDYESFIRQNYK